MDDLHGLGDDHENKRLKHEDDGDVLGDALSISAMGQELGGSDLGAAAEAKPKKKKAAARPKADKTDKGGKEAAAAAGKLGGEKDKEFEVPLAAINKILKASLPEGAICTKDAKSAFSKAAGIFVLYITSCANDMAKGQKRSTINAQDIVNALTELGYAAFLPHIEATLSKMKAEAAARKDQRDSQKKPKLTEGEADDGLAAGGDAGISGDLNDVGADDFPAGDVE